MSGQDGEGPGVGAGSCVIAEPASPGLGGADGEGPGVGDFGIARRRDQPCFYGRFDTGDEFHLIPGKKKEFQNGWEDIDFA